MYILNTNVVSELRKAQRANSNVRAWVASAPSSSLYLSVITILELEMGILLAERRDTMQGKVLRSWLKDQVLPAFVNRMLSIDLNVAQRCAMLHVPHPKSDRDALIAATALTYGMTVVTRNVSDFETMNVELYNPWT